MSEWACRWTYKLEHHVQLLLLRRHVFDDARHVWGMRALAYGHGIIPLKHLVHLPQELLHSWSVAVLEPSKLPFAPRIRNRRIVHVALAVHVDGIHPKPVDAALEPKLHGRLVDGRTGFRILPIEIRLLGAEEMEIVFFRLRIPLPHGAAKVTEPVVGREALAVNIAGGAPDVPVALWVRLGGARFLEPGVLWRSGGSMGVAALGGQVPGLKCG